MIKKYSFVFLLMLVFKGLSAQAPQKFSYQAVITDSSNKILKESQVGMKISVLQGKPAYNVVYSETQTPTTNENGLISIEIGTGSALSGSFSDINWAGGSCFIKTEIDFKGGNNYTITDTSELLSVPYALYAQNSSTPKMIAGMVDGGFSPNILSGNGFKVTHVASGRYQILFDTPFVNTPTVVANTMFSSFADATSSINYYVKIGLISNTGFQVVTMVSTGNLDSIDFSFVAIGN